MVKATGIVRRIDDLGRVVIPMEIRRTLRMRDQDPLEIFLDRDRGIILKRYTPIKSLEDYAPYYATSLYEALHTPVIITDTSEIIIGTGLLKKEKGKLISPILEEAMNKGGLTTRKNIPLIIDGPHHAEVVVAPILAGEKVVGCIALGGDKEFKEGDLKAIEVASKFLGKMMVH